jgi:hypothetical protein
MSQDERQRFENLYLNDDELFAAVASAEDEMLRSYLKKTLPEPTRRLVETSLLSRQGGRDRLEFVRSLEEYLSSTNVDAPGAIDAAKVPNIKWAGGKIPWWSRTATAALNPVSLVLLIVLGLASIGFVYQIRRGIAQRQALEIQSEHLLKQIDDVSAQLEHQQQVQKKQDELIAQLRAAIPETAPFILSSHLARGGAFRKPLMIPSAAIEVPLQMNLTNTDFALYSVRLETAEGNLVWTEENVKSETLAGGRSKILVQVPAQLMSSRNYVMKVSQQSPSGETAEVAAYEFRAVRRPTRHK